MESGNGDYFAIADSYTPRVYFYDLRKNVEMFNRAILNEMSYNNKRDSPLLLGWLLYRHATQV